jgi:hypothetical protein
MKAYSLRRMFEILPADFPSARELRIQNAKLERLLIIPHHGFTVEAALGSSNKKNLKRIAKHHKRVREQERKLFSLLESSFKIWLRKNKPNLTNKDFSEWKKKYYQSLDQSVAAQKRMFAKSYPQVLDLMRRVDR